MYLSVCVFRHVGQKGEEGQAGCSRWYRVHIPTCMNAHASRFAQTHAAWRTHESIAAIRTESPPAAITAPGTHDHQQKLIYLSVSLACNILRWRLAKKEGGRNRSLNNTRFHVPPRHPATLPPSWWNYTLPWIRSYSSCIHTPLPPHPPKHWCFLYLDGRLFSLLFTSLSSGWKRLRGREWTKTLPCHHSPSLFIYFCKSCEKIQNTF